MHPAEKRLTKKNGVLLATSGLVLVQLGGLLLRLGGFAHFRMRSWLAIFLATFAIQGALWLIPHRGWDSRVARWDPHYIYLPMLMAALQLNLYAALVPQARFLILLVWFVASLFMAGLAGFREVVLLSAIMIGGYLAVLNQLIAQRVPISLAFEHTFALAFAVCSVYAGVVFESLRRDRIEMQTLRRRLGEMAHTDPLTGRSAAGSETWTNVLSDELVRIGEERADVVTLTAAMLQPVGLQRFSDAFPERTFDVGIAEQHAVTSAAGLAMGGMHPVVCIYATFLNRAFDQALLDVALHELPVTFVLDREDGHQLIPGALDRQGLEPADPWRLQVEPRPFGQCHSQKHDRFGRRVDLALTNAERHAVDCTVDRIVKLLRLERRRAAQFGQHRVFAHRAVVSIIDHHASSTHRHRGDEPSVGVEAERPDARVELASAIGENEEALTFDGDVGRESRRLELPLREELIDRRDAHSEPDLMRVRTAQRG